MKKTSIQQVTTTRITGAAPPLRQVIVAQCDPRWVDLSDTPAQQAINVGVGGSLSKGFNRQNLSPLEGFARAGLSWSWD